MSAPPQLWRLIVDARAGGSELTPRHARVVEDGAVDERIRRAIAEKRLLEVRYKGADRLAEPHDYGIIDGTVRLLVFQLRGPASGRGAVGWRLLDVLEIESCVVTDRTFAGSRGSAHQNHYQWERLYARVT